MKNETKRVALDIDIELHKEIKIRAASRNESIKDYVLGAIDDRVKKEDEYQ